MQSWNRSRRAAAGRETLSIIEAGGYDVSGAWVDLTDALVACREGTESYPPERSVPRPALGDLTTRIRVQNRTTLSAARDLADVGPTVALNFASAKKAGGGFQSGARAQEESLATKSCLYDSLKDDEMYPFHRERRDPMYSPWAIYSPNVPVIRSEDGDLLAKPWSCSFITAPAPNAKAVLSRAPERASEISRQMELRIERILAIAAHHGHEHLVLGAWGCGVFGNDGGDVARFFENALRGQFAGVFEEVVFAVLDWSSDERFIGPFRALSG